MVEMKDVYSFHNPLKSTDYIQIVETLFSLGFHLRFDSFPQTVIKAYFHGFILESR